GSSLAIVTASFSIRDRHVLLAYGAFVGTVGALLFALEPDLHKLAYWGGMLPAIALAYQRLSVQLATAASELEYQEKLERSVEDRSADLALANRRLRREANERARLEEDLRVAQKMEAVGRLAGGVAHEFNNLLTTIQLYAELARNSLPPESPLHPELKYILKAGRQASDLTRRLLSFSRREESATELLDLNEVINDTSPMLRHLLGEDVRLICQLDDGDDKIVRATRGQVEQVLVNLALNARDAMPEGGRFVLETRSLGSEAISHRKLPPLLKSDEYVMLAVGDTGVGMDPETRARAFDPFFTRKQTELGTGLGLSIVYGILNQHGGTVRVESEPGQGARFELFWPRSRESPVRSVAAVEATPSLGAGERLLLVEDEPDLRLALRRVLVTCGYTVLLADGGESALRVVDDEDGEIDLVITDVVMPRMSGLELAERLRAKWALTKILLISGQLNHPSLRERDLPVHVTLLRKPFQADDLMEVVREILVASDAQAPERATNSR
ncbi:MAG: ATP-binding protein, partial [Myxococcota bacterium]